MNINIKATGIELTPAISDYAHKKVSALEKYVDKNNAGIVAKVEVGKSTHHHKSGEVFRAEVQLSGPGVDLYVVSEKEDLYAAIDEVKDEAARELSRFKDKKQTMLRRGGLAVKDAVKGFPWGLKRFKFKGFKKRNDEV